MQQLHHRRTDFLVQSICPGRWVGRGTKHGLVGECVRAFVRKKCCAGQCPTVWADAACANTSLPDSWAHEEKCLVPQSLQRCTNPPASPRSQSPSRVATITQHVEGKLRRRGDRLRWKHVVRRRRVGETLNKQGTALVESRTSRPGPGGRIFERRRLTPCRSRVCTATHVDGEDDGDAADGVHLLPCHRAVRLGLSKNDDVVEKMQRG